MSWPNGSIDRPRRRRSRELELMTLLQQARGCDEIATLGSFHSAITLHNESFPIFAGRPHTYASTNARRARSAWQSKGS
jgi:hypothetical protein